MPVQYSGITDEHVAVRQRAGLFDVSHMGEIEIRGERAFDVCQELTVNDVARLGDGEAQYSLMCLPSGGVVDDIMVHRLAADRYFLCVNAGNTPKDFAWVRDHVAGRAEAIDRSSEYALLALQGPLAERILAACTKADVRSLRPFTFLDADVGAVRAMVARTGYTGEDGFELYAATKDGEALWSTLMDAGAPLGMLPAGLGARDTLRLERALPLYGHELDEETTPLEARLGWVVKLAHPFIGRDVLARQKAEGVRRQLVGLRMTEPGIPRQGYPIWSGEARLGAVTSGTRSPTLGKAIALGYVTGNHTRVGEALAIEIRGRRVAAEVVTLPFYKRTVA